MDTLKGFVEHIIYNNPQNGYGVINLVVEETLFTHTIFFLDALDSVRNVILKQAHCAAKLSNTVVVAN